ncbi:COP9 signalosome complex subunit 5 [Irineochytrium annulatum]|nr:COP9 signalosome complex subunit 5 [Irineochytrium annulatum]
MSASDARKRFDMENDIKDVNPDNDPDRIYYYDNNEVQDILRARPWTKDPNHFKKVKISAVALIKMVMHARSGGNIEVMGLMQGKIQGDVMIIMDAFALPVEGTETRVNAAAEGNEYMVDYIMKAKEIDPNRTIAAGKVEIGAFRTYPEGYKSPDEGPSEYQSIPLSKIEDFGVHCKQYYPLEISYFKSSLDMQLLELLWNKYWVNTLSSSPLLTNREYNAHQIADLAEKIDQADSMLSQNQRGQFYGAGDRKKGESGSLSKVAKDSSKISVEASHALISQVLKNIVFNSAIRSAS